MSGLTGALDIGKGSLLTSQLAMNIISNNIANANTLGYCKQTLQVKDNNAIAVKPGSIGTGVVATQVTRSYNNYLNSLVNTKTSDSYYWSAQQSTMSNINTLFNESSDDGINALMSEFWGAWGDLANTPDGSAERTSLLSKSDNLLSRIKEIETNLRSYQQNLDSTIEGDVTEVNSLTQQIADLNKSITSTEVKGSINANNLRDERDLAVEKLSAHLNITYSEDTKTGALNVYILGGTPLVQGDEAYNLSTGRESTTGSLEVVWNNSSGRSLDITDKLDSGDIAGAINVRDNEISSYLDSLDTFTRQLVWQVNSLHSEGTGLKSVSQMAGTVQCAGLGDDLSSSSTFLFGDKYNSSGTFDITVYDGSGNPTNYTIDTAAYGTANGTSGTTVGDLIGAINSQTGGTVTAALDADGHLQMTASASDTFAVNASAGGSSSNALAILGVNTFFSWNETAGTQITSIIPDVNVNQVLTDDPEKISAGYLDSNHEIASGSNDIANAINALQNSTVSSLGNATLDGYYSSLVAQVGVDVANVDQNVTFNKSLLSEYTTQQDSVSGVSTDDEMVDLLKWQYLYQASAKLISSCDEMMQALLSMK
jgi:flagellar hook-associated protein 1